MGKNEKTDLLKTLNSQLKGTRLVAASDVTLPFYDRIPTGIASLDFALKGGWPQGAVSIISGPPASGKDFIANSTIAQTQKLFQKQTKILLATLGYGFDRMFMRYAGVQIPISAKERLLLTEDEIKKYNKRLGEIFFLQPAANAESRTAETLEGVVTAVGSGEFNLVVVNELGMEEPKESAARKLVETRKPGASAALFSQFARRLASQYVASSDENDPNRTSVLLLAQVRSNYGNPWVPITSVGGYALKHLVAIELGLQVGGKLKDAKGNHIGNVVKFKLVKGKYGTHDGLSGAFNFYFETGVDIMEDLITLLVNTGGIKQNGPWYTFDKFGIKAKGTVALKDAIKEKYEEVIKWVYTSII